MSWVWLTVLSAIALGLYDVAKKVALKSNGVYEVLLVATALSTLFVFGFAGVSAEAVRLGTLHEHLLMMVKAVLVSTSWVSGMMAMKTVPLTTLSTIKASRPIFVIILSILLFGERLSAGQWIGISIALLALFLLGRSSRRNEGIEFTHEKGVLYAFISVFSGVFSALFDKHILRTLEPFFVQGWSNVYITLILGAIVLLGFVRGTQEKPLRWDWALLAIAVLISVADALYFYALHAEGALLSIVSMIRRGAVIVTFALSAVLFKEKNVRNKAIILGIMLVGVAVLLFVSR